jgi:hypothetical protein
MGADGIGSNMLTIRLLTSKQPCHSYKRCLVGIAVICRGSV